MQLKNNNPVTMEKRTDLASLFCMVGRHGPAVAVAVIAMVSVVAGFIIYRTMKGKRRKTETGAGDVGSGGSSPAALRDAQRPDPKTERRPEHDARTQLESTEANEDTSNAREARETRSKRKLRNRRGATAKIPESSSPPEKLCSTSDVGDTSTIPLTNVEKAVKNLQNNTCKVEDVNVEGDGDKHNLVECPEDSKDAEDDSRNNFKPAVVCDGVVNEEKVQGLKEDDSAPKDVPSEIPCHEEENVSALKSPACRQENASVSLNVHDEQNYQVTSDTIAKEGGFEELTIHVHESLMSLKNEDKTFLNFSGINKTTSANEDPTNLLLQKQVDNVTESKIINLGELSVNCAELLSSKELEQEASTGRKETGVGVDPSLFGEPQETAVLISPILPCLSLSAQPKNVQDEVQAQLSVGPQLDDKIEEEVTPDVVKGKTDALLDLGLKCHQSEIDETVEIAKENSEMLTTSTNREPDMVVSDVNCAKSMSTEMSCSDEMSFQNKGSEMQNADDLELPTAPAPVLAESIESQINEALLLCDNQSKSTWCSPDAGEESGISSMTISPDLPEADGPLTPETMLLAVMEACPESEHQTEIQTIMAESQVIFNEEPVEAVLDSSNNLIYHIKETDSSAANEMYGHETESFSRAVGQPTKDARTDGCLNEDLGKPDTKIVAEGKGEEEGIEEEKTEINIMEATMDNNEWITEGADEVLPWMKLAVPNINSGSQECIQTSFSVDATCTNEPPIDENGEADNVFPTDEPPETGKMVLAVQPIPQNVSVTFRVHYLTYTPYQKVAVTGNQGELGNWKDFITLEKAKDGFWTTVVSLPAESHVEWKFVVVDRGEVCRWEECGNRLLDTGNRGDLLVQKRWGFL